MSKLPSAWIAASVPKVTAKLDMSENVAGKGLCPECKAPMQTVYMGDDLVLACAKDRIVLPMANKNG
jgi:hypothetical protein